MPLRLAPGSRAFSVSPVWCFYAAATVMPARDDDLLKVAASPVACLALTTTTVVRHLAEMSSPDRLPLVLTVSFV